MRTLTRDEKPRLYKGQTGKYIVAITCPRRASSLQSFQTWLGAVRYINFWVEIKYLKEG